MTASNRYFYAVLLATLAGGTLLATNAAGDLQMEPEVFPYGTVTVLPHTEGVLGKTLIGASGEPAGRIVDVLADQTGQVRAALVDFGGFLGIGSRKIAVAWSGLRFGPAGNPNAVAVNLTRENLARAPEVKAGQPVIVISGHRPAWHRSARQ